MPPLPDYRALYEGEKKKNDELEKVRRHDLEKLQLLQRISAGHKIATKRAEEAKKTSDATVVRLQKELSKVRAQVLDLQQQLHAVMSKQENQVPSQQRQKQSSFGMSVHEPVDHEDVDLGELSQGEAGLVHVDDAKTSLDPGMKAHHARTSRRGNTVRNEDKAQLDGTRTLAPAAGGQLPSDFCSNVQPQEECPPSIAKSSQRHHAPMDTENERKGVDAVRVVLQRITRKSTIQQEDVAGMFAELSKPSMDVTVDDLIDGFVEEMLFCASEIPGTDLAPASFSPHTWFEVVSMDSDPSRKVATAKQKRTDGAEIDTEEVENSSEGSVRNTTSCEDKIKTSFVGIWCKETVQRHAVLPRLLRCIVQGDSQITSKEPWISKPLGDKLSEMALMGILTISMRPYVDLGLLAHGRSLSEICAAACVASALRRLTASYKDFQVLILDLILLHQVYKENTMDIDTLMPSLPAIAAAAETWPEAVPTAGALGESLHIVLKHSCAHIASRLEIASPPDEDIVRFNDTNVSIEVLRAASRCLQHLGSLYWGWDEEPTGQERVLQSALGKLREYADAVFARV